ncbi:hypothetical protein G6F32_016875 [Rhizopus arrhizus]|nr:hypothetical protein G6F32_016875 [Rhizopus arrhizus]
MSKISRAMFSMASSAASDSCGIASRYSLSSSTSTWLASSLRLISNWAMACSSSGGKDSRNRAMRCSVSRAASSGQAPYAAIADKPARLLRP